MAKEVLHGGEQILSVVGAVFESGNDRRRVPVSDDRQVFVETENSFGKQP